MGNNDWLRDKFIWVAVMAFLTLTSGVVANDRLSRNSDAEQDKEISGVQQTLAAQTVELRYLGKAVEKNSTLSEKILTHLDKLNND